MEEQDQDTVGLAEESSPCGPVPTEVTEIQCLKVLCEDQLTYRSSSLLFHCYSDGPEDFLSLLSLFLLPLEAKGRA